MIFYTISKILNMKYCNLSYEMIFFLKFNFLNTEFTMKYRFKTCIDGNHLYITDKLVFKTQLIYKIVIEPGVRL